MKAVQKKANLSPCLTIKLVNTPSRPLPCYCTYRNIPAVLCCMIIMQRQNGKLDIAKCTSYRRRYVFISQETYSANAVYIARYFKTKECLTVCIVSDSQVFFLFFIFAFIFPHSSLLSRISVFDNKPERSGQCLARQNTIREFLGKSFAPKTYYSK